LKKGGEKVLVEGMVGGGKFWDFVLQQGTKNKIQREKRRE